MRNPDEGFNKIQIYDLGRYNTHSDLGGMPPGGVTMDDLYNNTLPRMRPLAEIGAHVMQDRLKFNTERTLCKHRLGDAWEHRHILTGLISNGCMRDGRMAKELPTLSWIVSNSHILWLELLSEVIYHPSLIQNAFNWRIHATNKDQMWELDGTILRKLVPILETKIHDHRVSVRDDNDPLISRPLGVKHSFVMEINDRAPGLWKTLKSWRRGLRTQLIINLLMEEGHTEPQGSQSRCILSKMLWHHHGSKTKGIDHYLEAIRTVYSIQSSPPVCKWPDSVTNLLF